MDRIPSPRILTLDPNDENIILEIPEDKGPNNLSVLYLEHGQNPVS